MRSHSIVGRAAIRPSGSRKALALMAAAAFAAPISAQTVRPYRSAFDVSDYTIAIDLPETGASIHAVATLTLNRTAPSETLTLDLLDLTVNGVTVDGRPAKFSRTTETIVVPLPAKRGARPTYTVAVDYGGVVKDGLIARVDSAGRSTFFGDNWPDRARHWIPSIDHPSDKATVTWRVTAPASQTVVANGRLISTRAIRGNGAPRTETVWREMRRIPVYLMVIAAAPLERFDLGDTACGLSERPHRCVAQFVYTAPEQRGMLPGPFARAGEIVQLFGRLVGPFPYEKLAHLQSSTRFGGMENASAIFYSDESFRQRTMNDGLIAHETAHQWFGDAVTERDWAHLWLSEGFATYFAALWTRAARGDSAFRAEMSQVRETVLSDSTAVAKRPVIDSLETNYLALLNRNSYQKGGFVLQMLRAQVGERAFFDALRSYYTKYRHATAVTDDLRAEVERESKQQLGWFFDQWLRRPGYPEVTATWSYDAEAREAVIELSQGTRFGLFQFPITVAVLGADGSSRRTTVRMTATPSAKQRIRVPFLNPPTGVILDPDVELLASLTIVKQ